MEAQKHVAGFSIDSTFLELHCKNLRRTNILQQKGKKIEKQNESREEQNEKSNPVDFLDTSFYQAGILGKHP